METAIWVIEGALTGAFFMAGLLKVILPKNLLDEQLSWARDFSPRMVQFIGTCEILGAIGLFLPRYLDILPFLTPVAGFLLAILMILAARVHFSRKEYTEMIFNGVLFVLSLVVAIGVL